MNKLQKQIIHKIGKAINDFGLIEESDNIIVGLSGGKDSFTLIDTLLTLQKKAPVSFSVTGITIDSGFENFRGHIIRDYCLERKIPYILHQTDIMNIINDHNNPKKRVCSFCARLRRGALYTYAEKNGYNKIALGHHADDLIETVLMNMLYSGAIKAMSPYHTSDDKKNIVIRPLVYVSEEKIIEYAREMKFPVIDCGCPMCTTIDTKRAKIKGLLLELQMENPHIKSNLLKSLSNITHSHLLFKQLDEAEEKEPDNPLLS